ncbi:amidophosphoribosyltransferase [Halobacillus halophilus]|uniref:Amidophosphoribosyltransferase n=1 Tax=Halobacillus halophilus (strain ATCC 35676 / DSM 2266 / JCM 20832 / KCTC 3685 / LMG 17431 / NBRC 102448 / NCIMB 2269) TaxID=866895 RepID=I0JIJ6_HALH3|nr:amidophosphoribosyltransferase [Halobacillus halophilus]ASF38147.1 amidophosphoribosyltransferase [Halobacillus halophilus]CCG43964.1 amidophosphoribosyltransferase [Halobacillus halophilus DSM 2266]
MPGEIKGLNEECGIFGVWGHPDSAQLTYYGLHALQHRGQEGAGIVTTDGKQMKLHKGHGLINEVFSQNQLQELKGHASAGHVRYATAGDGGYENIQPLVFRSQTGSLALAHNGNLVNAHALKSQLEGQGSILTTTSDTEVVAHLIKRARHLPLDEAIMEALSMIKGAYAFLLMTEDQMFVANDPRGLRPISLGQMGDAWVVSSETCGFDVIGATHEREVKPGELVVISNEGVEAKRYASPIQRTLCSMEYVYFSRPDSNLDGKNVHASRKRMGKALAKEAPVEADVVTGVPDSSISAAIGYAEESGIPYELGLIKNRYVGRTFIQPSQELREQGVKMKLSAVRGIVEGKRVVMVDDSIVRGTTSRRIVQMLKDAGASEVHVRIASPPIKNPCYYGIDTANSGELIASNRSVEEIEEQIGADSLTFLSPDGLNEAIYQGEESIEHGGCMACFTGNYPTEIYPNTAHPYEKL